MNKELVVWPRLGTNLGGPSLSEPFNEHICRPNVAVHKNVRIYAVTANFKQTILFVSCGKFIYLYDILFP